MKLVPTLAAGAVAGAVGTLAMDVVWFARARRGGSDKSFTEFEFSGDTASFEDAGAPAQIGKRAAAAVGVEIPDDDAGLTTDVVHWVTGVSWGIAASVLHATTGLHPLAAGVTAGGASFAASYTVLPPLGIYDPIWEYDAKTVWKDATAHATYGAATGLALAGISAASALLRHRSDIVRER